MQAEKILVALDDSEASGRLVSAAAARALESEDVHLVLCHLPPPLPPRLLETRGSEDPKEEERIEARQEVAQARWIAERTAEGERLLATQRRALERCGVAADRIETRVAEPVERHEHLADAIVDMARALGCGTIAVGRGSFSALRAALNAHLADQLRDRVEGIEVWEVDC